MNGKECKKYCECNEGYGREEDKKYKKMKCLIDQEIEKEKNVLARLNDDLADHPELSGQEYESSAKIVELLRERGYQVEYPFAGFDTAFRGVYGSDQHKYKIAILTEYDALPEIGHACGHCLSGAISVLAGLVVKELQDELDADIHIIGTPNEEREGAKCTMVHQGIFDPYDMAMMVHLYDQNLLAPKLQAMDSYLYKFKGKAVHASTKPWEGVNALNGVQLMFHAIDMLRQHVTPDVRMHGVFRNGGAAPNIVPEEASAEVFIRSLDRPYLNDLVRKVDDCARGAAIATQSSWEKEETAPPFDNLCGNEAGLAALKEVYEELEIPLNGDTEAVFGSSDAGNVSFVCPTFHPCLQVVKRGIAIHTREFAEAMKSERAHRVLADGAKIIAYQIAKIFSDEERIKAMRADGPERYFGGKH